MKDFLHKLNLLEYLKLEIEIDLYKFVDKFRGSVGEGATDVITEFFDAFSSSKNEYKGHVDYNGFKIKKRRRMFDMNFNFAVAKGNFEQVENKLIINTEINGFSEAMIPYYAFCIVFYLIFFFAILFGVEFNTGDDPFVLPFIIIHAFFMLGLPYFMMKRSVKKMKYDLEREFYYQLR